MTDQKQCPTCERHRANAPKSEYKYEFVVPPTVEQTLEMERAAHRATCRVLHDAAREIMRLRGLGG